VKIALLPSDAWPLLNSFLANQAKNEITPPRVGLVDDWKKREHSRQSGALVHAQDRMLREETRWL
jgi:hypothetical protein